MTYSRQQRHKARSSINIFKEEHDCDKYGHVHVDNLNYCIYCKKEIMDDLEVNKYYEEEKIIEQEEGWAIFNDKALSLYEKAIKERDEERRINDFDISIPMAEMEDVVKEIKAQLVEAKARINMIIGQRDDWTEIAQEAISERNTYCNALKLIKEKAGTVYKEWYSVGVASEALSWEQNVNQRPWKDASIREKND